MKLKNAKKTLKRFEIWKKKHMIFSNETIRSLGDGIYTRKANIVEPEEDHSNLFKSTVI